MENSILTTEDLNQLRSILERSGAILRGERLFVTDKVPLVIDLDRVWHNPDLARQAVDLLCKALLSVGVGLGPPVKIDTILAVVTQIGSFGIVPLAAAAAIQLQTRFVIFDEYSIEHLRSYPSTFDKDFDLQLGNVAILHDVILRGSSVVTAVHQVKRRNGCCSFILTVADLNPPERILNLGGETQDAQPPLFALFKLDWQTKELIPQ